MTEHPESGFTGRVEGQSQSRPFVPETALRMAPNITDAEALAVFRRKLPGADAEVRSRFHPFWWTVFNARTSSIFRRRASSMRPGSATAGSRSAGPVAGQRMNVLVNAYSGKGFIAEFEPRGHAVPIEEWLDAFESSDQAGARPESSEVRRTARSLVRTKVLKTVKLGMGVNIDEAGEPRGILKPNWVVTGANDKYSATILVDGLDSSHYIVRVAKL